MIGSQTIAAAAHGIVVTYVRSSFAEASGRDIIGKESRQPERVVAEMHHDFEATVSSGRLQVRKNINHIMVPLVVVPINPPGPIALPELQEQGCQIISNLAVIEPGAHQRMADEYVEE